jgi:catechol 2,3-dioxygenase-like lactoylglutathione lyase family enzyme
VGPTANKLLIVSGIKSGNDTALNGEIWDGTTAVPWNFTSGNSLVNSRYAEGHAVYLAGGGGTAVFEVEDLDVSRRGLEEKGVRFDEQVGEVAGYARFASFPDPDGNTVQIIEYLRGR